MAALLPLSDATLAKLPSTIEPIKYNRTEGKKITAGIVHFGVGAFHRSHQALYLDEVIAKTGQREWGIVGVGLLPADIPMRDGMHAQDCLYTVTEKSPNGDAKTKVVQSMVEYIYAPDNFEFVVNRLVDPAIRIISLTITEGGYLINNRGDFIRNHPTVEFDLKNPCLPQSAFGIIIEALVRRRANGTPGFTIMSCDNLRHNGNMARKACLAFANARDPEIAQWIEKNISFPNSMVDRITPAMNPTTRGELNTRSGIDDKIPVICEDYTQWVLEDNFNYGRPSYEVAGVTVTNDVIPYEEIKIRLLNGAHSMLSFPAFLSGFRRVDVALTDPVFKDYIVAFLNEDAGPHLKSIPGMELNSYKETLLKRFGNAAVGDQLWRLCYDGGSKIPGFLLPTLDANLKLYGTCQRLAYLLASYCFYLRAGKDEQGNKFDIIEPAAMPQLKPIQESTDPMELLNCTHLVGNAAVYPQFVQDYLACYTSITKSGTRATLENLHTLLKQSSAY